MFLPLSPSFRVTLNTPHGFPLSSQPNPLISSKEKTYFCKRPSWIIMTLQKDGQPSSRLWACQQILFLFFFVSSRKQVFIQRDPSFKVLFICHSETLRENDLTSTHFCKTFPLMDTWLQIITSLSYPEYNFRIPIRTFCLILIKSKVQVPNLEKTIRDLI